MPPPGPTPSGPTPLGEGTVAGGMTGGESAVSDTGEDADSVGNTNTGEAVDVGSAPDTGGVTTALGEPSDTPTTVRPTQHGSTPEGCIAPTLEVHQLELVVKEIQPKGGVTAQLRGRLVSYPAIRRVVPGTFTLEPPGLLEDEEVRLVDLDEPEKPRAVTRTGREACFFMEFRGFPGESLQLTAEGPCFVVLSQEIEVPKAWKTVLLDPKCPEPEAPQTVRFELDPIPLRPIPEEDSSAKSVDKSINKSTSSPSKKISK